MENTTDPVTRLANVAGSATTTAEMACIVHHIISGGGKIMTKNYLSAEALTTLLTNIRQNMETGDIEKCTRILVESVDALNQAQHEEIDRAYIGSLREKKRMTQIEDIRRMLDEMTAQQVQNVYKYTSDEYIEPNHEAVALEAIMQISKKRKAEKEIG